MSDDSRFAQTQTRSTARRQSSRRPDARLHVVYPPELASRITVGRDPVVLGRQGEPPAPRLRHPTVSRRHLTIAWDGALGCHIAEDLGSHNGSWRNAESLGSERVVLADDDVLRLGDVVLVYESTDGSAAGGTTVSRDAIPGDSYRVETLRGLVERAAADPSPVLLIGETGTGKELVSREVHRLSARRGRLLAINCAELSPQLIESQLFGHEKGAFTGAISSQQGLFRSADGGSLFLDEIGELPLELQPKLLRVLQEGEVRPVGGTRAIRVDVRVIAATNRDLLAEVEAETFRRDLYARLALWELHLPPLRERRADTLSWVARFHERWLSERPKVTTTPLTLDAEAAEALVLADWPENLRGVDRVVHRLAAEQLETGEPITRFDVHKLLPEPGDDGAGGASDAARSASRRPAPRTAEELEAVMNRFEGSVRAVAKHYGRDRRQVYRWLKSFGLREE